MYDPTEWVRREASKGNKFIVVTGNFRMNLLGFLACSDLAEEDPDGLAGNYGKLTTLLATVLSFLWDLALHSSRTE
jgi:carboxylesterase type B